MPFEIRPAYGDTDNIKELFAEYTEMLFNLESKIKHYLNLQDYESELKDLNKKYGPPDGRLYIAYSGGQAVGCVALRKMNREECEMKRLYVRPRFRSLGIGRALVDLIIGDAGKIGYQYMFLDTLPGLTEAVKLYELAGFYRIPAYNNTPIENTIFMKINLR